MKILIFSVELIANKKINKYSCNVNLNIWGEGGIIIVENG